MIMTKDFDVITEFPVNVDEEGEGNQNKAIILSWQRVHDMR